MTLRHPGAFKYAGIARINKKLMGLHMSTKEPSHGIHDLHTLICFRLRANPAASFFSNTEVIGLSPAPFGHFLHDFGNSARQATPRLESPPFPDKRTP